MSDPEDFRSETRKVFCFLLQEALRNQEWKVSIRMAGRFESIVKVLPYALPYRVAVRPKYDEPLYRRVVRQLGLRDDLGIPFG